MARQLTFRGGGKLKTWFANAGLDSAMSRELIALGYGVTRLKLLNVTHVTSLSPASLIPAILGTGLITWNYTIEIVVNSPDDENPERVRNLLVQYFSMYFDNVELSVVNDTLHPVTSAVDTVLDSLGLGGNNNSDSGGGNTGSNAFMVVGILAIALIGVVVIGGGASGRYRR